MPRQPLAPAPALAVPAPPATPLRFVPPAVEVGQFVLWAYGPGGAQSPALVVKVGTLSLTLLVHVDGIKDHLIKAVVFGFGQGQELSEHTAAKPAMLYFVKGEASVGLGDDLPMANPTPDEYNPP